MEGPATEEFEGAVGLLNPDDEDSVSDGTFDELDDVEA